MAEAFAHGFDGKQANVGDMKFQLIEKSIVVAGKVYISGEHWFKCYYFVVSACN